jgi:hypothetical protein
VDRGRIVFERRTSSDGLKLYMAAHAFGSDLPLQLCVGVERTLQLRALKSRSDLTTPLTSAPLAVPRRAAIYRLSRRDDSS